MAARPVSGQEQGNKNVVIGSPGTQAILPPELPWGGKSRSLAVSPEARWATPCERTGLTATPRYDETVAWLRSLVETLEKTP